MRVALVHDWLTGMRGGERVLHEIAGLYPDADLYTLVHVPGSTSPRIEDRNIHTSALSRLPGVRRHYRALLPLFPMAIEAFRLRDYDLVVSTSHAVAKGIRAPEGAIHICYCFTPMRYIWDQIDAYLGRGAVRMLATPLVAYLRHWDRTRSGPERVHTFLAISRTIADRIRRHYGREAPVLYPPVDTQRFVPDGRPPDDFFLLVGGFVPYKRDDIAIDAFRRTGQKLVVAGDGPGRAALAADAPPNVEFTGRISDAELAGLYARCRALIYPSNEDFGIVPVEAQACGRPVIAYGAGGAAETVVPPDAQSTGPPTGIWFPVQTSDSLAAALERFGALESQFECDAIRAHAEVFSVPRFQREFSDAVNCAIAATPANPR